jgi:hypothetical protein
MSIGHSQSAQDMLKQWRSEHVMGGLFTWLAKMGRADEEVRKITIKSINCNAPSRWHQTSKGNVVEVEVDAIVDSFDIEVSFADTTVAQKTFTERELRFTMV